MPDRIRKSYVVTEFGYAGRLGSDPGQGPAESVVFTGLGWMKSLSPHWALGGVIQVESDLEDYQFAGIGARARWYLGDIWSLEGTAGLFAADYGFESSGGGAPFFADLGANLIGSLTIFARYEHHDYHYVPHAGFAAPVNLPEVEVSEDALSAGIRMGPRPRFLVIPAVVLVSLLFVAGDGGTTTY